MPEIELSYVVDRRGAPMGRHNDNLEGKCRLQRMTMIDLCYDRGGAYWGMGDRNIGWMYASEDEEGNQAFTRATTRERAKESLLENNPNIRFYR